MTVLLWDLEDATDELWFDDNNSKRVCRLYFNTRQKYVGFMDEQRNEERVPIESPEHLHREYTKPYTSPPKTRQFRYEIESHSLRHYSLSN